MAEGAVEDKPQNGFLMEVFNETISSPINIVLLAICGFLIYKIFRISREEKAVASPQSVIPSIPKLKKQDMTLSQLRHYDGTGEHKRVCVGINGKVFDMTKGSRFYGPGGPYAAFAGHDATHALATFNMVDIKNESSDLSNLTNAQMESVREWEMQFTEKYEYIGKLLKEGEQPTEYSDEEEDKSTIEEEKAATDETKKEI